MSRTPGAKDKQPRKLREVPSWESSPIIRDQKAEMPEGYNKKLVSFMLEIIPTEPLDLNDVPEMERRFTRYLQLCAERDVKVGNQGAYTAIGITKDNAYDWVNRRTGNPARADFIKKVQQICALYRENLMADGKVNPVTGIFWQKNYDGMKDQQEVVLTPNNPLGDAESAESLKQKYIENTYGAVENTSEMLSEGAESDFKVET